MFKSNKTTNFIKKIHFKPTCLCIVRYVRFTDTIHTIRTYVSDDSWTLTIRNFLYTIRYVSYDTYRISYNTDNYDYNSIGWHFLVFLIELFRVDIISLSIIYVSKKKKEKLTVVQYRAPFFFFFFFNLDIARIVVPTHETSYSLKIYIYIYIYELYEVITLDVRILSAGIFCTNFLCIFPRAVNKPSQSWTTRARFDKKLVHVCLFINKTNLSLSFRLV